MATDKEKVDYWMDEIRKGIDFRSQVSTIEKWDNFRNMYRGKWDKNVHPINRVFSYGRSLIPRVYSRCPRVSVTPKRPELVWHARVVEAIDNALIRELRLKYTLKRAILDSYLCGIGAVKSGFDSLYGYIPEQAALSGGETVTQVSSKVRNKKIEYLHTVKPGMPWSCRVFPENIIVPWGSTDPESLRWVCNYILRPLDDVKEDAKYKNTSDLKGTREASLKFKKDLHVSKYQESGKNSDSSYAELFEMRDYRNGEIVTICEDKIILDAEDALQSLGLPYDWISFNEDPEWFWPISDLGILEPSQDELNEVRTQISRHRKISLLKFLYRKGAITETELEKFLSGEIGVAIGIEEAESLANAIMELTPHIPGELYNDAASILQEMQETLGFSANQLAQFKANTPPTATETQTVSQSFGTRTDERVDIVSDVLVSIIEKWNSFIFKFWDEDKVTQITSPEGEPMWIKYTGKELEGNYKLIVDPDSGIALTQAVKFEMTKGLLSLFNGDPMIDQMMLRKMMLNHFASVDPLADMLIKQPPMPLSPETAGAIRQPEPVHQRGGSHGGSRQALPLTEAVKAGGS